MLAISDPDRSAEDVAQGYKNLLEGGYEPIAERVFNEVAVDRVLLEYDDKRSGSFEPLRFVAPGKTVVLGLVSSKPRAGVAGRRAALPDRRGRQ